MDEETNDLIVPLEEKEVIQDGATSQWFGNSDWFDGLEDGAEVDQSNINQILKDKKKEKKPKKESAGPKSEEMGDEEQMEVEVNDQIKHQGKIFLTHIRSKIIFWNYILEMIDEREIESDSSDEETESDDSEDERQRVALREMEERIGSIPERREEKLSKRKVRFFCCILF